MERSQAPGTAEPGAGGGTPARSGIPWRSVAGVGAVPQIGAPAPNFRSQDIDGKPVALAELRGKAVMVNFWATWCGPCRTEMPEISDLYTENRARGFEVMAVNLQEEASSIRPYAKDLGLAFVPVLDRD